MAVGAPYKAVLWRSGSTFENALFYLSLYLIEGEQKDWVKFIPLYPSTTSFCDTVFDDGYSLSHSRNGTHVSMEIHPYYPARLHKCVSTTTQHHLYDSA